MFELRGVAGFGRGACGGREVADDVMVFPRNESADVFLGIHRRAPFALRRRAELRIDALVEREGVGGRVELPVRQAGEVHGHDQRRLTVAKRLLCLAFIGRGAQGLNAERQIVGELPQQRLLRGVECRALGGIDGQ